MDTALILLPVDLLESTCHSGTVRLRSPVGSRDWRRCRNSRCEVQSDRTEWKTSNESSRHRLVGGGALHVLVQRKLAKYPQLEKPFPLPSRSLGVVASRSQSLLHSSTAVFGDATFS